MNEKKAVLQHRRGTAAQWESANPILFEGQLGLEMGTSRFKIGDGTTRWNDLPYASGGPGPEGPQGEPGPAGFSYVHNQDVPVTEWIVNHNLDGYPSVSVVNSAGDVVEGAVRYESKNTITIVFSSAFAGSAYFS